MDSRLIPGIKNAAIIVTLLLSPSLPVSLAADNKLLTGEPFRILNDKVSQVKQEVTEVQAALPPLAAELEALLTLTPPDEILVLASKPCPEGYVESVSSGLPSGFKLCVRGEILPPPPPPKVCQEGYVLNESLSVGNLVVCEQITGGAATVYVTHLAGATAQGMTLTAQCPESFVVTGGGYASEDIFRIDPFFQDVLVYASKPLPPDRWMVGARAVNGFARPLSAYAICIRDPNF